MPINPIKEQRKISKTYTIGYYSVNSDFGSTLENTIGSNVTAARFLNLYNLSEEAMKLYLSVVDDVIFDSSVPKDISKILTDMNLFVRVIGINDVEKVSESIHDRSDLVLEFKKGKNFEQEKDLRFIMQIVNILENKDPYTKDHSARVAKYALAIGEDFFAEQYDELYGDTESQNPDQYEQMKHEYIVQQMNLTMLAAWAHDIGKNSIAQDLLNKDSKLTDSEYDIMKMHADFGANMIRKILGNEEFAEILENHHERIDGFGYHSLTEFSDISKIIAIADSFDAMTTARSYTTKLDDQSDKSKIKTAEEAINELLVASHLHFDLDENRMSQQLDTRLTSILVRKLKRDLDLIKNGKTDEVKLLSGGIDEKGYIKAGFWDDKSQEYSKDKSVSQAFPNLMK